MSRQTDRDQSSSQQGVTRGRIPRLAVRRRIALTATIAVLAASCSGSDETGTEQTTDTPAASAPESSDAPAATDPPVTEPATTTTEATTTTSSTSTTTTTTVPPAARALALGFLHAEPDVDNGGRVFDDRGREVLLRGVNVNSYAEYWDGTAFPAVVPFTAEDADQIAEYGWNVVRLLFTWSLVEPEPGSYDEAYLDELEGVVRMLEERGIYTILDSHQDAWGATLAARPDEVCDDNATPAVGWDGAPGWATLVADDTPRCAVAGIRELSPAVQEAATAFFTNAVGPGDVGIRTRYAEMWGHIAERFANDPAIAGYDLMNEPNAFDDAQTAGLSEMYTESLAEIRAGEAAAGGESHIVIFEPWALWSSIGMTAPLPWEYDDNIAYSPHLYEGAFTGDPLTSAWFDTAVEEAKQFGGPPIITGEWGPAIDAHRGTQRTGPDGDGYFLDHQNFQDELHLGATLWMWDEGCGDPHRVKRDETQAKTEPPFDVECADDRAVDIPSKLVLTDELTRGYPWFAPGGLDATVYDHATGSLEISGSNAEVGEQLVVFYPTDKHGEPEVTPTGLEGIEIIDAPGGSSYIVATTTDANWAFSIG